MNTITKGMPYAITVADSSLGLQRVATQRRRTNQTATSRPALRQSRREATRGTVKGCEKSRCMKARVYGRRMIFTAPSSFF
jgi:hypothetical protein